jgi:hypothetical protein
MKMAKSYNGFNFEATWMFGANVCTARIYSPYMNKCPCVMQSCWWRWNKIRCHFLRSLGSQHMCFNHAHLCNVS